MSGASFFSFCGRVQLRPLNIAVISASNQSQIGEYGLGLPLNESCMQWSAELGIMKIECSADSAGSFAACIYEGRL